MSQPTLANEIQLGLVLAMVVHCYLKGQFHRNFAYISVSCEKPVDQFNGW